jgi:hypothetical protein
VWLSLELFLFDCHFADRSIELFVVVESHLLEKVGSVGLLFLQVGDVTVSQLPHYIEAAVQLLEMLTVLTRNWAHSIQIIYIINILFGKNVRRGGTQASN